MAKPKNHIVPRYLIPLLFLTAIYLVIECSFNAELLDTTSRNVTLEEIEDIEHWGRIISGVALALAICGSILFPYLYNASARRTKKLNKLQAKLLEYEKNLSKLEDEKKINKIKDKITEIAQDIKDFQERKPYTTIHYAAYGILISIPIITMMYYGQKAFINYLADNSDAELRKSAAILSFASSQLRAGELLIHGFDLSQESLKSPSGKSFSSIFSFFLAQMPNANQIILEHIDEIILQKYTVDMPFDKFYSEVYSKILNNFGKSFNKFTEARKQYDDTVNKVNYDAEKEWSEYVRKVEKKFRRPLRRISSVYHDRIRQAVRYPDGGKAGLRVPYNWKITDKKTFIRIYKKQKLDYAKHALDEATYYNGEQLPSHYKNFDDFLSTPAIQKEIKKQLHLNNNVKISRNMTDKVLYDEVYMPFIKHNITVTKQKILSEATSFGDGEKNEHMGKDAVRAMIVPPIALAFSIAGAVLHICKTLLYLGMLIWIPAAYKFLSMPTQKSKIYLYATMLILISSLLIFPLYVENDFTSTHTYEYVENIIEEKYTYRAIFINWVIHAQTYFYPFNSMLRGYTMDIVNIFNTMNVTQLITPDLKAKIEVKS